MKKNPCADYEFLQIAGVRRKGFFHLDQPGEEEDERDEVEIRAPAWEAVDGSIHDENPSLLRRGLIYREYTGACKRRRQEGS